MASGRITFESFSLDPADRRLSRDGDPVELNSRYFDALALLVAEHGRLVPKQRFMDEVWRGVPVTDEALTQCIRALRRQLGDEAARPRFIETVPKHGYRFVAPVEREEKADERTDPLWPPFQWGFVARTTLAAALGGALAGAGGGLFYGLAATPQPSAGGMGALSILLVLIALGTLLGLAGGAGVGAGIGAARFAPSGKKQWSAAGGMFGGLAVGLLARLIGLDAFELLFGHAPATMTGPAEGALLGAAIGLAAWIARDRALPFARAAIAGAIAGGTAGLLVPLLGGHLLGGSLNLLAESFPDSRFRLDALGGFVGEDSFGRSTELVTATLQGALFCLCQVAAHERKGDGGAAQKPKATPTRPPVEPRTVDPATPPEI
jgi:DNA-binding winged helix-turn-helix (wHTH) protein